MEIIISLLLLLSLALIFAGIAERLRIPEVVANILAGMVLGPMVLGIVSYSSVLSGIAEVSLFFIMLLVGIESTTELLTKHIRSAALFTLSGFIMPVALMAIIGIAAFGLNAGQSIITSIAIGVPSISIISVLVMKYGLLEKEDGVRVFSSVVLTDVVAFVALAAVGNSVTSVLEVVGMLALIIVILLGLDLVIRRRAKAVRRYISGLIAQEHGEDIIFGGMILIGLLGSAILEFVGITYVLGAFFVGLLIHPPVVGDRIYGIMKRTFGRINNSFFIPIFFSVAGLEATMPANGLLLLLITMLVISGVVGGILNYLVGMKKAKTIGPITAVALLGGRGAVGIIIADIALTEGIITSGLYSVIVFGTVILSLALPALLSKTETALSKAKE